MGVLNMLRWQPPSDVTFASYVCVEFSISRDLARARDPAYGSMEGWFLATSIDHLALALRTQCWLLMRQIWVYCSFLADEQVDRRGLKRTATTAPKSRSSNLHLPSLL